MENNKFNEVYSTSRIAQKEAAKRFCPCRGFRYMKDGTVQFLARDLNNQPIYIGLSEAPVFESVAQVWQLDPTAGIYRVLEDNSEVFITYDYDNVLTYVRYAYDSENHVIGDDYWLHSSAEPGDTFSDWDAPPYPDRTAFLAHERRLMNVVGDEGLLSRKDSVMQMEYICLKNGRVYARIEKLRLDE